ncbi:hypothetical protein CJ030_MR1G014996 [Morella rubra]|uniref:TMV resistance protein N n=1 Tax=Morella rubra TaxID=262757 RepID=A0A6A1WNY2_9ROSI|nr:hypothetical protein CJ030_MR1G014996 [Morella rubra]
MNKISNLLGILKPLDDVERRRWAARRNWDGQTEMGGGAGWLLGGAGQGKTLIHAGLNFFDGSWNWVGRKRVIWKNGQPAGQKSLIEVALSAALGSLKLNPSRPPAATSTITEPIKRLSSSFLLLKNIKAISLLGYEGHSAESWLSRFSWKISPKSLDPTSLLRASLCGFCSLGGLCLSNCKLYEREFPSGLGSLSLVLRQLDLSLNDFHELPRCVSGLQKLKWLDLSFCTSLRSISELPSSVESLRATGCSSMERLSMSSISQLDGLCISGCENLVEIQGLRFESISIIEMVGCSNLPSEFGTSLIQNLSPNSNAEILVCLPGNEVPNWFSYTRIGFSTSFLVPPLSEGQIRMFSICAVYGIKKGADEKIVYHGKSEIRLIVHKKSEGQHYQILLLPIWFEAPANDTDNLLFFQTHLRRSILKTVDFPEEDVEIVRGDEIEMSFAIFPTESRFEVKKCGVHLLLEEPTM